MAFAHEVEVEMGDGLASIASDVHDNAVPILEAEFLCEVADRQEQLTQEGAIVVTGMGDRLDLLFRDDQDMDGRLGIDVVECQNLVVFIDDAGRDFFIDDAFEESLRHVIGPQAGDFFRADAPTGTSGSNDGLEMLPFGNTPVRAGYVWRKPRSRVPPD
jgi:hypothetical protein